MKYRFFPKAVKFGDIKVCPKCRGCDLERTWCALCDRTGFVRKSGTDRRTLQDLLRIG